MTTGAPAKISAEACLLLACSRVELSPEALKTIDSILAGKLDWDAVLQLADVHGLAPLLHRHLDDRGVEQVPKRVHAHLWARHELYARRNNSMATELGKILFALESAGIPAIPFKGPALALEAYGDIALREFGDLDLLLHHRDIPTARASLEQLGFHPLYPIPSRAERAILASPYRYHLALLRDAPRLLVELHWKTDAEFPVESEDDSWWRSRPRTSMLGTPVRAFAPDELILVLCLHGAKHFWGSFGWLVDVAELIGRIPQVEWGALIDRAEAMRAGRRLALGMHLLRNQLGMEFPSVANEWLDGQVQAGRLADRLAVSMFDPAATLPGAFDRLRMNFDLYESWRQRLGHLVQVVLAPGIAEYTLLTLPRGLFFLYAPLRWTRLGWKYLRSAT